MQSLPLSAVAFEKGFWAEYQALVRGTILPHQYKLLHDAVPGAEPSHAIQNFKIAAGLAQGGFGGMVFQDSDVAKWIEAAGYSLQTHPDEKLEAKVDEVVELLAKAQQPDGYLNSYYIINGLDKRFTNLTDCHELYCLGHFIEGAIAYYQATGKKRLLDIVCRYVDLVDSTFGPEEGKKRGCPGHQEIELALLRLYALTGRENYLALAGYFLDQRGTEPNFFTEEWEARGQTRHWENCGAPDLVYYQATEPVRAQRGAMGHAVRAVYMYTAMAEYARLQKDAPMLEACEALWQDITTRQMYVTGGIGQAAEGEAFTLGYDLPNETVYAETCAAVGLVFFGNSMLRHSVDSRYSDVMELALYNAVLAGMAQDGKHYFYVNPLEAWPEASRKNPARKHVVPTRPGWYACACCPPNVARLLGSLGQYFYSYTGGTAYVHLYGDSEANFPLEGGTLALRQSTAYPYDGTVTLTVSKGANACLALRIPGWCKGNYSLMLNGEKCTGASVENGYLYLARDWREGDVLRLELEMEVDLLAANPLVWADRGRVAVRRGPLVYCLEQADNDVPVSALALDPAPEVILEQAELEGAGSAYTAIQLSGQALSPETGDSLYYNLQDMRGEPMRLRLIPYYLWGNRGEGEMTVWIPLTGLPAPKQE